MTRGRVTVFLIFVFVITLFFHSNIYCQISGSKPDEGSFVYDMVEPKSLEIDADFYMEKYTMGNTVGIKKAKVSIQADLKYFTAPAFTFRYGVIKNLELQVLTGYTGVLTSGNISIKTIRNRLITAAKNTTGLSGLGVGFKAGLLSNKKARPSVSFTGIATLPNIGNPAFSQDKLGADLTLSFYNSFSEKTDLLYTFGTSWSGFKQDADNSYNYSISPGYSFSDNIGLYLEFTGLLERQSSPDNRLDLDFSAYLNDYITLDLYAGTSFNIKKFFFIGSTFTATIPF